MNCTADTLAKSTLRQQGCRVAPAQLYWHSPGCCGAPTRDDHFAPAKRVALQRLHCAGTCQGGSFHLPKCCIALIVIFPHCYSKCLKMCSIWQCIDICSNISNVLPSPISQMQQHSAQSCSGTDFATDDKTWPTQMYSNMPTWKLCWEWSGLPKYGQMRYTFLLCDVCVQSYCIKNIDIPFEHLKML